MKTNMMLLFAFLLLSAAPAAHAAESHTLRDFGGHEGVIKLTTEFVTRVVQDDRVNHFFKYADGGKLIHLISTQICAALGGPCTYTGRSMKETHRGMGVTTAHFNAVVEDLCGAMDHFKIPSHSQNKLLSILAPMWRDIVTK